MSDQAHRLLRRVVQQQGIQVGDVVREPIDVIVPLRETEATPIGGNDAPIAGHGIYHELPGGRNVAPAMQKEQHGARSSPQSRTCRRRPRMSRNSDRDSFHPAILAAAHRRPRPDSTRPSAQRFPSDQSGITAVASISTRAASSIRPATCTAVIAGKLRPITSRYTVPNWR
jgi:hypothetical protein